MKIWSHRFIQMTIIPSDIKYSETFLNLTSLGSVIVLGIDRCSIYTG